MLAAHRRGVARREFFLRASAPWNNDQRRPARTGRRRRCRRRPCLAGANQHGDHAQRHAESYRRAQVEEPACAGTVASSARTRRRHSRERRRVSYKMSPNLCQRRSSALTTTAMRTSRPRPPRSQPTRAPRGVVQCATRASETTAVERQAAEQAHHNRPCCSPRNRCHPAQQRQRRHQDDREPQLERVDGVVGTYPRWAAGEHRRKHPPAGSR